jgi:hypothetical protein
VRDLVASLRATSRIRGLTSMLPHSQCACALDCGARVDYERCFLPRTSAANHCGVAPKRTSDSGIFEGVSWSVRGWQNFRCAEHWLRREFIGCDKSHRWKSDVTNLRSRKTSPRAYAGFGGEPALALMDAVVCMEKSHALDRTRRSHEEMVPHDPASLGSQAICVQSLQSGPRCPL